MQRRVGSIGRQCEEAIQLTVKSSTDEHKQKTNKQTKTTTKGDDDQSLSFSIHQSISRNEMKPIMKTTTQVAKTATTSTHSSSLRRKNLPVIVCLVGIVVTLCLTMFLSSSIVVVEHHHHQKQQQQQHQQQRTPSLRNKRPTPREIDIQEGSLNVVKRRRRRLTSSAAPDERKKSQTKQVATKSFKEAEEEEEEEGEEELDHDPSSHTEIPTGSLFVDPILPLPSVSSGPSSTSNVLVLVMSHVDHIVQRQMIRETWAKKEDLTTEKSAAVSVNVVFVIGSVSSSNNYDLSAFNEEQAQYQDLLEIPIMENYDQLTEKLIQAYSWVARQRQQVKSQVHYNRRIVPLFDWVAKVDDDVFVDLNLLNNYVQKYNPNIPMLIGNLVAYSKVQTEGKWKDIEFLQAKQKDDHSDDVDSDSGGNSNSSSNSNTHYPYWAKGSTGHIISRTALEYIVHSSSSLHRYQGEDTSLGIWLNEGAKNGMLEALTYIHAPKMFLAVEEDHDDNNDEDPTATRERRFEHPHHHNNHEHLRVSDRFNNAIVIGHNLRPNDIQEIWNHRRQRRHDVRSSTGRIGRSGHLIQSNRYGTVWIGDEADEFETIIEREQYVEQTTEFIRHALLFSSEPKSQGRR